MISVICSLTLVARTITGMVMSVKHLLSSQQKKTDYKPENPGVPECTQVSDVETGILQLSLHCPLIPYPYITLWNQRTMKAEL